MGWTSCTAVIASTSRRRAPAASRSSSRRRRCSGSTLARPSRCAWRTPSAGSWRLAERRGLTEAHTPRRCTRPARPATEPSRRPAASDGQGPLQRGRAREHGPHRGGHGGDDRRRGPVRVAAPQRGAGRRGRAGRGDRRCVAVAPHGRRAGGGSGCRPGTSSGSAAPSSRASAVITRSFPLLLLGSVLIGFGNASNQLSRYAAADLFPAARRASAIGIVVWGATFGAVIGPNLIGWAGQLGESIGLPPLAGAYLLPIVFVGSAAILSFSLLRPDPYQPGRPDRPRGRRPIDRGLAQGRPGSSERPGRDGLAHHGPGRDDPDHDDDPAPHDGARPRLDGGRAGHQRATRSGCSRCRRSPAG